MAVSEFSAKHITDQKRLVRGEQLLCARARLRIRDGVHHAKWRVMILAGGNPAEEIAAIREVMPKAHITAVDRDPRCLDLAIDAGADEVVLCDLNDFTVEQHGPWSHKKGPAKALLGAKFDLLVLDLCAGPNRSTRAICRIYLAKLLTAHGVSIVTFSYGRDVIEEIEASGVPCAIAALAKHGASDRVLMRIGYLLTESMTKAVVSVMVYRGNEMPMCSVLLSNSVYRRTASFVQVEPGDFELAVTCPDPALLYACPQERIESLRRKHAAIKASYTRKKSTCNGSASSSASHVNGAPGKLQQASALTAATEPSSVMEPGARTQKKPASAGEWLTLREAAARAATSEATLRRWIRSGRLRNARTGLGGHIRIRPEWVDASAEAVTPVEVSPKDPHGR
jgi:excisionase family DNA binding protein